VKKSDKKEGKGRRGLVHTSKGIPLFSFGWGERKPGRGVMTQKKKGEPKEKRKKTCVNPPEKRPNSRNSRN